MITLNDLNIVYKPSKVVELDCQSYFKNIKKATKEEDINEHWDFLGDYSELELIGKKIDVKSMKRVHRSDLTPTEDYHWIEIQNVLGNKGWIYGMADFIAFETINDYLFVPRTSIVEYLKLINFTEEPDVIHKETKIKLNKLYKREKRKDLIFLVKTSDLKKITSFKIKKN
jgi:hypothetical protein